MTSERDREEYLLARKAEIEEELEALRAEEPTRREYCVGLPVSVSVDDSGWITVEVDLSELASSIQGDENAGPLGKYWQVHDNAAQTQAASDSAALTAWVNSHSLRNEGHADFGALYDPPNYCAHCSTRVERNENGRWEDSVGGMICPDGEFHNVPEE